MSECVRISESHLAWNARQERRACESAIMAAKNLAELLKRQAEELERDIARFEIDSSSLENLATALDGARRNAIKGLERAIGIKGFLTDAKLGD